MYSMFGQDFNRFSPKIQGQSFRLLDGWNSSSFDTYNNLKQQLLYHQYLSKVYQEQMDKFLLAEEYDNQIVINCPVVSFGECTEHCYLKHQHLYKCINCGQNKELKQIDIQLPDEILTKIFRSDPDLYHLSRIVSKNIRNLAFNDILQHEIIKPFDDLSCLCECGSSYSLVVKYFIFDPTLGEIDYYSHMYVCPYGEIVTGNDMVLHWAEYSSQNRKTKETYIHTCHFEKVPRILTNHKGFEEIYDVDYLFYYRMVFDRLSLYQCDQKTLAKQLTMNKINKSKSERKSYMMHLCATAYVLNMTIPSFNNNLDYEELITKLEPIVEDAILKL